MGLGLAVAGRGRRGERRGRRVRQDRPRGRHEDRQGIAQPGRDREPGQRAAQGPAVVEDRGGALRRARGRVAQLGPAPAWPSRVMQRVASISAH